MKVVNNLLDTKLQQIEADLKSNQKTINRIKQIIREIAKDSGHADINKVLGTIMQDHNVPDKNASNVLKWQKEEIEIPLQTCKLASTIPAAVDVQVGLEFH